MTMEELLDRRVPLAIVAALALQAGGIIWWASARDAELHYQQQRTERLETSELTTRNAEAEITERLARIEERLASQSAALERIEKQSGRYVR